jgi:hypothetical protein
MKSKVSWAATILTGLMLSGCNQPAPPSGGAADTPSALPTASIDAPAGAPASAVHTSAAPKESAAPSTSWGALRGRFVYQGTPPEAKTLNTSGKDAETCSQHPVPDESLLVDSASGGIKNVLVIVRNASRVHPSYEETNAPVEFDQKQCVFLSHVLPVRIGQTVKIKNSDPIGHNTNIAPPGDKSINPLLPAGGDYDHQFSRPQSIPVVVSCNIHPWMKAYILPRKDPYVAVTDKDGSFEISNLPAGEQLELQIWHERGAGPQSSLVARPEWAQGRFKVTIRPDAVEDLGNIDVAASAFK